MEKKLKKLIKEELNDNTLSFLFDKELGRLQTLGLAIDYTTHEECKMSLLEALEDTLEYVQERKKIIGE